jgi:CRP-like cAMP-binding protein
MVLGVSLVMTSQVTMGNGQIMRRAVGLMTVGHAFGHNSLMRGLPREYTVTTRTDVHMLVLSKEDYLDIFQPSESDGVSIWPSFNLLRAME